MGCGVADEPRVDDPAGFTSNLRSNEFPGYYGDYLTFTCSTEDYGAIIDQEAFENVEGIEK